MDHVREEEHAAIRAFAEDCRRRVPDFAARHFSFAGTLRLHREALGLDLVRAPINVLLVAPSLFLRLAGTALLTLPAIGNIFEDKL